MLRGVLRRASVAIDVRGPKATVRLPIGSIVIDDGLLQAGADTVALILNRGVVEGVTSVRRVDERLRPAPSRG